MNAKVREFEKSIKNAQSDFEKETIRKELKAYVATFSDEEYGVYRKEALASIERTMAEMDKLLEAYELMKNNMLQYS
jgi:transcription elongation GreA/GreB family factor